MEGLSDYLISKSVRFLCSTDQLWRKNSIFLEDNEINKSLVPKGILTGRATESEVASSATARVIMQRLVKDA